MWVQTLVYSLRNLVSRTYLKIAFQPLRKGGRLRVAGEEGYNRDNDGD
jgi:hypothetical protein